MLPGFLLESLEDSPVEVAGFGWERGEVRGDERTVEPGLLGSVLGVYGEEVVVVDVGGDYAGVGDDEDAEVLVEEFLFLVVDEQGGCELGLLGHPDFWFVEHYEAVGGLEDGVEEADGVDGGGLGVVLVEEVGYAVGSGHAGGEGNGGDAGDVPRESEGVHQVVSELFTDEGLAGCVRAGEYGEPVGLYGVEDLEDAVDVRVPVLCWFGGHVRGTLCT